MTTSPAWRAVSVLPTLSVTDLDRAADFYGKLGFEEEWRYPEGGEATHLGMSLGEVSFMFWHCPDEPANRQNLYLIMKGLPSFHERVRRALPEVGPILEADYGMVDFSVTDPWGHLLTFGEES